MRGVSRTRKLLAAIRAGDGAPAGQTLNLTSDAFQGHRDMAIASCKPAIKTGFRPEIYATIS